MASQNETMKQRNRKNNGKGPKKPPQRGLGVEQLERMRVQETLKKMAEASGIHIDHQQQQQQLHQCHFGSSNNNVPLRSFHFPQQQMMINENNNNNVGSGFVPFIGTCSNVGAGLFVPNNQQNNRVNVGHFGSGNFVRNFPFETSKELSSIPNLNSQSFDLCLKKTRLNEENVIRGTNAKREMPMEVWSNNVHDFLGFMPQPPAVQNFVGENGDFYNKLTRHDASVSAYATHNLDECAEVVAVHRRGNSGSGGRVFMEYEFFPGKDGRGTTSKELEFPTNSNGFFGEASSSITFSAYGDTTTTASNSNIDLSLKL